MFRSTADDLEWSSLTRRCVMVVRLLFLSLWLAFVGVSGRSLAQTTPYSWEHELRGDAVVLLGEIHDNAEQHRLRLELLSRAFAAGWRPAIAMEQFDHERQADIDRARAERPLDSDYLIQQSTDSAGRSGGGWNWEYYRPYIDLALRYRVPLLAANLSRHDAMKIVEQGYSAVFDDAQERLLGLNREPTPVRVAQQREIDRGHCHKLPKQQLPQMARAQMARDALMANIVREHAGQGVVLLAGDGHVRRDIGVPTWLDPIPRSRVLAVGFLESGDAPGLKTAFDAMVITKAAVRSDPCLALKAR